MKETFWADPQIQKLLGYTEIAKYLSSSYEATPAIQKCGVQLTTFTLKREFIYDDRFIPTADILELEEQEILYKLGVDLDCILLGLFVNYAAKHKVLMMMPFIHDDSLYQLRSKVSHGIVPNGGWFLTLGPRALHKWVHDHTNTSHLLQEYCQAHTIFGAKIFTTNAYPEYQVGQPVPALVPGPDNLVVFSNTNYWFLDFGRSKVITTHISRSDEAWRETRKTYTFQVTFGSFYPDDLSLVSAGYGVQA